MTGGAWASPWQLRLTQAAGVCRALLADGAPCQLPAQCLTGHCAAAPGRTASGGPGDRVCISRSQVRPPLAPSFPLVTTRFRPPARGCGGWGGRCGVGPASRVGFWRAHRFGDVHSDACVRCRSVAVRWATAVVTASTAQTIPPARLHCNPLPLLRLNPFASTAPQTTPASTVLPTLCLYCASNPCLSCLSNHPCLLCASNPLPLLRPNHLPLLVE